VLPGPQGLRPGEPGRGAPASRVLSARRARARSAGGGRARRAARASSPRAAARLDRPASELSNVFVRRAKPPPRPAPRP
jgi:hypothetical protein